MERLPETWSVCVTRLMHVNEVRFAIAKHCCPITHSIREDGKLWCCSNRCTKRGGVNVHCSQATVSVEFHEPTFQDPRIRPDLVGIEALQSCDELLRSDSLASGKFRPLAIHALAMLAIPLVHGLMLSPH